MLYLFGIGEEPDKLILYATQLSNPWKDSLRTKIDSMPDNPQKASIIKVHIVYEIQTLHAQMQKVVRNEMAKMQGMWQSGVGKNGGRDEDGK